ncbi:hypothetical protein NJI34_13645 [Pseudomonas sp. S 311-6]|nr:hypothetical protein [Pseudomonas sp. S 311-6]
MEEIFKRVFEKISKLTDLEFEKKLDGVSDHPLTKLFDALGSQNSIFWDLSTEFAKRQIDARLLMQSLSYEKMFELDRLFAANDQQFLIAA